LYHFETYWLVSTIVIKTGKRSKSGSTYLFVNHKIVLDKNNFDIQTESDRFL